MLQRDSIRVSFKYDRKINQYISKTYCERQQLCQQAKIQNPRDLPTTLSSFSKFLKNSPNFPCTYFTFADGNLRSNDLQEFLEIHGRNIKRMSLDVFSPSLLSGMQLHADQFSPSQSNQTLSNTHHFDNYYPSIYLLKKLLVHQAPQLIQLYLDKSPIQWNTNTQRLFPEPKGMEINLPNLKCLILGYDIQDKIFSDLLKAGINLIEATSLNSICPLLSSNKFHLVKNLVCEPNPEQLELYEKCLKNSKTFSRLEFLHFTTYKCPMVPEFFPNLAQILQSILQLSTKTLKSISWGSQIGYLPNVKIPKLERVKSMKIVSSFTLAFPTTMTMTSRKYFPKKFQLKESFPNLRSVMIDLRPLTGIELWEDYFDYVDDKLNPVLSVRSLVLKKSMAVPSSWLRQFSNLFPNLEILECQSDKSSFPQAVNCGLWSFKKLRNLTFNINLQVNGNCYPDLDAAFTGFSNETCVELQDSSDFVDIEKVEDLREHGSIVDLKDLRTLKLKFVDESSTVRSSYPPIWTHVTGLFAFKMCPKLDVKVEYSVSKANLKGLTNALSPVFPYIGSEYYGLGPA